MRCAKEWVLKSDIDNKKSLIDRLLEVRGIKNEDAKRELWLQFATKEDFEAKEQRIYEMLYDSDGEDSVVIYISSIKAMKRLPANYNIRVNNEMVNNFTDFIGKNNVKVVEKSIEKKA